MIEKLRAKFPATTSSCSMVKIGRLNDSSLDIFLTPSKSSKRPITAAKKKSKERKEREKKSKVEKTQVEGHFLKIFYFCPCLSQNVLKRDPGGKNG